MKKIFAALTLALLVSFASVGQAGEGCGQAACDQASTCGGGGGCIWGDSKADFALGEEGDALKLAVVVNGCPGKRAAFRQKLADELARDARGEACPDCPFGVAGLAFKAEDTEIGATVTITGPADKRAEFKARYEKKIAKRTAPASEGGCGCKHGASAPVGH